MSEYIKISDVIKICKHLYSSFVTTTFFNTHIFAFENLLRTVAVEFPEPPVKMTENENEEPDEIEETYMDDVGGIHSPCDCYNPYGYFCGDCGKLSCKDCKYRDLQPDKENNDD